MTPVTQQVILHTSTTNREVNMKIGSLIKIRDTDVLGIVVGVDKQGCLDVRGLNGVYRDRRYIIRKTNMYVEVLCK